MFLVTSFDALSVDSIKLARTNANGGIWYVNLYAQTFDDLWVWGVFFLIYD